MYDFHDKSYMLHKGKENNRIKRIECLHHFHTGIITAIKYDKKETTTFINCKLLG